MVHHLHFLHQRPSAKVCVLAISTGILSVVSFPTCDLYLLAWISLVPLVIALRGQSLKKSYALSFLAGLVSSTGIYAWIWTVQGYNILDYGLMGGYLANYWGLWGLGLTLILRRTGLPAAVVGPALWVALEYLRSHVSFLSLPFMLLGHSQHAFISLIQITALTGVYGISFLIVAANVALGEYCLARFRQQSLSTRVQRCAPSSVVVLVLTGLAVIAVVGFGTHVLSKEAIGDRIRIAVVQGSIPQDHKWDKESKEFILSRYETLTRQVTEQSPEFIVWPETAVPGDILHERLLGDRIRSLARELKTPLLVGSAENAKFAKREMSGKYFNSAFLISADGNLEGQYKKIILVPFGEYVPLREHIQWPEILASDMGDMVPGEDYTVFTLGNVRLATLICWETIFPDLVREFAKRGARLIVNPTNEAMFRETAISYQYLAMSTFRAVENGVVIIRAANTGVSAFIDPFGRIIARLRDEKGAELFVPGTLVEDVLVPIHEMTFYTRHGDLFALVQILLSVSFFILCAVPERGRLKSPAKETYGQSRLSA
jgi:apolipoprotein N-acyltransferase